MKKSSMVLLLFLACTAMVSFAANVPAFEARIPLSPEDPAMLLAGLGGVGIAAAYIRAKLKR